MRRVHILFTLAVGLVWIGHQTIQEQTQKQFRRTAKDIVGATLHLPIRESQDTPLTPGPQLVGN